MKRLIAVVIAVGVAAAALAAWGLAAPSEPAAVGPASVSPEAKKKKKLPPLPAEVRRRKRWNIGVKCDVPPFGYIDVRGRHQGFDVEIARWFSRFAFGRADRIRYICAPTPAREPMLTSGRADIVVATFTYTQDRDTRIDFSRAYYRATGRLLVRRDGPVKRLADIANRTVSTTTGSIYDRWMRRCFPSTRAIVTDSFTNAVIAFRDGRADAVMWDDTGTLGIATQNPDDNFVLTNDLFLVQPYGIGIRQGNRAMKRWVDSRLNLLKKRDQFIKILRRNVPARNFNSFRRNVLRPKNSFAYVVPPQASPETVCP
jgi:polar amino acid transport system substrate-binding protein